MSRWPLPASTTASTPSSLSRDGRQLLYTRSTEQQDDDDFKALRETYSYLEYGHGVVDYSQVWSLDLVGWTERKLVDDHRVVQDLALSPDGKHLAMITTPDDQLISHEGWSRVDVLDLDADDAEVQHLTSPQWRKSHPSPYGWLENLAWSDDSKALAFMISFDGYPSELYVAEWLGGSPSVRKLDRPAEVTVSDFGAPTWRADSRDLCYMGEDRARLRLYEIANVRGGRQGDTRTLTPDDVVIHAYSVPRSGKGPIAVVKSTTTDTRNVFLLDGPGEYTRLTQVNPQVDTWKLPQISIVKWSGARGDTVEGILELPPDYQPGDGPLPLVVELHGGPTAATLYRMRFWIYGRTLLAAKGYALLSPNYRGSTGYGDDFMTDLVGHENNIEIEDILKGVDAMIERGIADPEHLAVMGWSNGGLLTNCIITHTDRFKAASTGAGIVDMVLQWGTEDTPGHVINYMEGFPWEKPDAYRHASAVYALDKITTPTLIHVGGSDHRCPPAHSQALHRALHRYLDVPTQLVVYPGEGHSPLIRKHRLAKMKWDLAWFDKYLLGKDTANEESEE